VLHKALGFALAPCKHAHKNSGGEISLPLFFRCAEKTRPNAKDISLIRAKRTIHPGKKR